MTLYHQYSSLLTSIRAIRYQDEFKKAGEEEVHSLSVYGQSANEESRDSVLKKINLFIERNHIAQQNNLVQLKDYDGLKNFRDIISDLKAAVEIISMDGSHEHCSDGEDMTVSDLTH